ncbi:hypothetical protein VB735_11585 [Halotia wernerae UHCC 0503]|nr:hypothetical protein [Halotia wernerae UHCC 0503]
MLQIKLISSITYYRHSLTKVRSLSSILPWRLGEAVRSSPMHEELLLA